MHGTTALVWFVAVAALAFFVWYDRQRVPPSRAAWAVWPSDERPIPEIARYWLMRREAVDTAELDDRTWTDLNMDDVFRSLDRNASRIGQQVLYSRLRGGSSATLDAFDALATRFEADPTAREAAERALRRMRGADAGDLWTISRPGAFASEPWHVVFPLIAVAMAATAGAIVVWPGAVLALAALLIAAFALRASAARHLRVAGDAFRQMEPVLAAGAALGRIAPIRDAGSLTTPLGRDLDSLAALRRIARWAGRDTTAAASGELSAMAFEYLNMAFSLDGNAVYFGARELRAQGEALARVVHAIGEIDAALSVASYRAGTIGWSKPAFEDGGVHLAGIRHPLVPDAVPATVDLAPPHGVIVTGANMSGKTTFLRTLGVNAALAQSVATCTAESYRAPRFVVRSCIGRTDDPAEGKSYYLVEVEAVLGLVAAARDRAPHLFLFDELFRGTNTVERIAAGEAVLRALVAPVDAATPAPHVVIAATHDQELVDLLAGVYAPYHFTDRVDERGLVFDYELRPGPARTRNAIALLARRGAPPDLVQHALERAKALTSTSALS